MIPKIIHYCWFSKEEKPLLIQRCIKSWEKIMPDYQIKCWDADSFDFNSIPYVKEAFEKRKWAFVADYIRFYAVYQEGGIYLDSDIEIKKSLTPFFKQDFFIGTETLWDKVLGDVAINPESAIFGSVAGHPLLKKVMEYYEERHFILPDGKLDLTTNPDVVGSVMETEYGYKHENKLQQLKEGITVYPTTVFCNLNNPNKKGVYAIHQFANSWRNLNPRGPVYKFCKKYYLMPLYRQIEKINNRQKTNK
jgi:hypothetical protein